MPYITVAFRTRQRIFCAFLVSLGLLFPKAVFAQTTNVVILDSGEIVNLRHVISHNKRAKALYDSITTLARMHLREAPRPLKRLFYEGLLETNPDRIETRKSLEDMDKVIDFIYASYACSDTIFAHKTKQFVLAWADTYQPDGNPINENKFVALYWGYYLFQNHFSDREKIQAERWMTTIAHQEMRRERTPNNNWEAKRQKMIAIIGSITGDDSLTAFARKGFKEYINTAYFPDGTSADLKQRDALHYHVSGLKPLLSTSINLTKFDSAFNLYHYLAPSGASVKKSVAYVVPYARGELERKEWINTIVALDKERAAAGLAEYQPGKLFDPKEAVPLFEWASYYQPAWYDIIGAQRFTATWVGLLNSPLVRQ